MKSRELSFIKQDHQKIPIFSFFSPSTSLFPIVIIIEFWGSGRKEDQPSGVESIESSSLYSLALKRNERQIHFPGLKWARLIPRQLTYP
jgi:hypothetical protein